MRYNTLPQFQKWPVTENKIKYKDNAENSRKIVVHNYLWLFAWNAFGNKRHKQDNTGCHQCQSACFSRKQLADNISAITSLHFFISSHSDTNYRDTTITYPQFVYKQSHVMSYTLPCTSAENKVTRCSA